MDNFDDDQPSIAKLLEQAGRRPQPPAQLRQIVFESTLAAWQQSLQQRRRVRQSWWLAIAASLGAMMLGLLWIANDQRPVSLVAALPTGVGEAVRVGQLLRIQGSKGRVFTTVGGETVRVAVGTELVFVAPDRMQLLAGRLYVQSEFRDSMVGDSVHLHLKIETRFGSVQHVGTQYSVEIGRERLQVSVRDGRVSVATRPGKVDVSRGQRLLVGADAREVERQSIPTYGAHWAWAEALAPPLQIDGRLLLDVLQDIALETGRRLEFADEEIRMACMQIRLNGPFLDMPATDRLFAVLVTTGLEATESGDRIRIQRQTEAAASRPVAD
jgi:ferric-dicitrate binding protein FerR (iron transport regulator)